MAINRFITAGVALASAGAIAAIPAIAPPLAPRDIAVVNDARVQLSADITDLINTYFGQFPGDPDNAGTTGISGVVQQILQNMNVNDPDAIEVIDGFFGSGASEVIRILLTRDNADPVTVAQINAFFNGGVSDLVRLRLWMFASPEQRSYIDKFFVTALDDAGDPNFPQFGVSGVFYKWLTGTGLSPDQQEALDIFFNRGTPVTEPDPNNPNGPEIPVLDENGEPVFEGSSNPAMFGFSGLAYRAIKDSGLSPDQEEIVDDFFEGGASQVVKTRLLESTSDPDQIKDINAFFDVGISENFRWRLVDGAPDQRSKDLWNEFFDNGVTGVVRYLLTGPLPDPPVEGLMAPAPPENLTLTKVAAVEDEDAPDVTPVAKKAAPVAAAAPVVAAAPPAAPVAAPAAPKFTAKIKEKETEEAEETDLKGGNKVEPIIIETGGPKAGEGGFGVFGEIAGAIGRFVTGQGAPKSPTTATTTDTTSSTTDGESAG